MIKMLESVLLAMALTAGVTACSNDEESSHSGDGQISINIHSMDRSFSGVWTVDNVKADTTDVRVMIGNSSGKYKYTVTYRGFPYKAIAGIIAPDVHIADITSYSDAGPLSPDKTQLFQSILDGHGSNINSVMTENYLNDYRCVGVSESTLYLELLLPETGVSVLYIPFIVTTNQGELFAVVATLAPSKSTANLNVFEDTFINILTVSQIEIIKNGETQITTLSPEMKLKFTSIKKIEPATVGN
jgi:hypothetical protein